MYQTKQLFPNKRQFHEILNLEKGEILSSDDHVTHHYRTAEEPLAPITYPFSGWSTQIHIECRKVQPGIEKMFSQKTPSGP